MKKQKRSMKRKKRQKKIAQQKQYVIENKNAKNYELLVKLGDEWINPSKIDKKIKLKGYFRTLKEVKEYVDQVEMIRNRTDDDIYEGKIIELSTGNDIAHILPRFKEESMSLSDAKDVIKV